MEAAEIDLAIADLDERLEKLRILYDQYFSGIERFEPLRRREELERKIKVLRRENIRNTGQRFKFQQILQRYTTFSQYWTRILREIEKGTFKRDLARAAKRFGAAATSKNATIALQVEETSEGEDLSAEPQEEYEELDSSFIEEQEDEDTSPFRRPDFGPPEPLVARMPAPPAPEPSSASRPPSAPMPSTPRPASTPGRTAPSTAPTPPPAPEPVLATPIPAPAPRATPAPVVLAPARRPTGARLDLEDDDLLGGGAPALPRPVPSPPAARPVASVVRPAPTASPTPLAPTPAPAAAPTSSPRPAPAAPRPEPVPRPEPAERPVAARVPPASPRPSAEPLNEQRLRDIYDRYVEAKRKCNESTAAITYDGLARSLRDSVPKLQQKHGGQVVDFEVVIKDGRTVLKPVVKGA